jgi:hypothetical protein
MSGRYSRKYAAVVHHRFSTLGIIQGIKVGTSIRIFWAYYFEYPVTLEKQSHRMREYVG